MDAATITALGDVLLSVIGAIFTGIATLRGNKKIDQVQTSVNGNTAITVARSEQLAVALSDAGIPVPPTPIVPPDEPAS